MANKILSPYIIDTLQKSISDTMITSICPNKDQLAEALSLQSDELSALTERELSKYIYTLSQYIVYLQVQCNSRHIKYLESKRRYELALAKGSISIEAKTLKEKARIALSNDPELQKYEKILRITEADYMLFEKIPESVTELVNALKKELSIRIGR